MADGLKFIWWERPRPTLVGLIYVDKPKAVTPISPTGPEWRIGYGPSNILIAEGAAVGLAIGKAIFEALERGDFEPSLVAAFGSANG